MERFMSAILGWVGTLRREEGQAAVEYGVLIALIIAVCVTVITTLGTDVSTAFQNVVDAL